MLGRVHGDEHGQRAFAPDLIGDGDTARRGERLVVGVDRHDVVVFGDRPIGPELVLLRVVNRIFGAQSLKHRPVGIGLEEGRLGWVQLIQRRCIDQGAGVLGQINVSVAHDFISLDPSVIGSFVTQASTYRKLLIKPRLVKAVPSVVI